MHLTHHMLDTIHLLPAPVCRSAEPVLGHPDLQEKGREGFASQRHPLCDSQTWRHGAPDRHLQEDPQCQA